MVSLSLSTLSGALKPEWTYALHCLSYQLLHSRLTTHRIQINLRLTGKSRLIFNLMDAGLLRYKAIEMHVCKS